MRKVKVENTLLDIKNNYNHSIAEEIIKRNQNNLDKIAIIYRNNEISYKDMIDKVYEYAKSLKTMGYKKGDEIPVCMSSTPEFYYLYLAISLIGCKINSFPHWIDINYLKMIINNSNSENVFISSNFYDEIKEALEKSNIKNIVSFSLLDSLPTKYGIKFDPYEELDNIYCPFEDYTNDIKKVTSKEVMTTSEFENVGKNYDKKIREEVNLDDDFTITYSSGTTSTPKAILHTVGSDMTCARFKDKDVSNLGEMKDMRELAHFPTYIRIALTAVNDAFMQRCQIVCEPIYNRDAFPYTLLYSNADYVNAGSGFWTYLCMKLSYDPNWKNVKYKNLLLACVTGESMRPGEEKFFNKVAREHKFGVDRLPFPFAPITMSIGGGTSEQSGVFVTLFKGLKEKMIHNYLRHRSLGLIPAPMVDVDVLDENGKPCEIGETGIIVVNSPCNMKKYYYSDDMTKELLIKDINGKEWMKINAYGIKVDNKGQIYMKGRYKDDYILSTGERLPLFMIEDAIEKDTKNIMACHIIDDKDDHSIKAFIELQPEVNENKKIFSGIIGRLKNDFPKEIVDNIELNFLTPFESYPLYPSGKIDVNTLLENNKLNKVKTKKLSK